MKIQTFSLNQCAIMHMKNIWMSMKIGKKREFNMTREQKLRMMAATFLNTLYDTDEIEDSTVEEMIDDVYDQLDALAVTKEQSGLFDTSVFLIDILENLFDADAFTVY